MRSVLASVLLTLLVLLGSVPAWAQAESDVAVTVTPPRVETTLGQSFDIAVSVTNRTDRATVPVVAHIDITDPASETSVDPEDWTPTLSKGIGAIPAGETVNLVWSLQPISPGTFSVYAVVLSSTDTQVFVSDAVPVSVASTRTLNPEGVLPVVIAGPIVVGGLLAAVVKRGSGRSRRRPIAR